MQKEITAKQIHEDFYGAEERLYVEAIGLSKSVLTSINDKSKRLQKLGFGKAQPVKDCEQKEAKRKISGHIIHTIEYFRTYYPQHKFITEEEVKKLCEKYGLLLGDTGNYIGDVPEKNLRDIEAFKLRKEDWREKSASWFDNFAMMIPHRSLEQQSIGITSYIQGYNSRQREEYLYQLELMQRQMSSSMGISGYMDYGKPTKKETSKKEYEQPSFKICAPKDDFHTSGWEVRDGYRLVYDPIVLQPVSKEGQEGFLIVTAWGDEASDEIVVNETKN